jgi:hypothetical protein
MSTHTDSRPKRPHPNLTHLGHGALLIAALMALLGLAAALQPSLSYADQMTVFSCHGPAGEAVGHDGWTIERLGVAFMTAVDTCANEGSGGLELVLGSNPAGYGEDGIQWNFDAPAWASIASYELHIAGSYALPADGGGDGQAFVDASDESDPVYDYRNLGGGSWGPSVVTRTPPAPVSWIATNASCDDASGDCPANTKISRLEITAARIVLDDSTIPTVSDLAGALVSGSPQTGESEVSFEATDTGPGVYAAYLVVDGEPQPASLLDSNNGWCESLGQTSDGTRSFAHPDPCAPSLSTSLTLNTAQLTDGTHTVKLIVEDAAGDPTIGWNGTITTDNTPANSTGTTTGSTPGAGAAAPTPNGTPASESATLQLNGLTALTRSYARRAFTLTGRLTTSQSQPIADATLEVLQQIQGTGTLTLIRHASTSATGTFTIPVPAGPSRIIEVAYRALSTDSTYAASARVRESVKAGVKLNITPHATGSTGKIILTGRVQGPIPPQGAIVELLVHYRGHWEPFRDPHTNSHGYFKAVYQFQGDVGRFPFQAEIPTGQANLPYTRGYSNIADIHTT